MKSYIFITTTIRNIGGAQLYISRKREWLESCGWKVLVYYYNKGVVKIDNLLDCENNCIEELSLPYPLINKKIIDSISSRIINQLDSSNDFVIIESHTINLSLISEVIAKKIQAKHLAYWLSETFDEKSLRFKDFFFKKLSNNTLYGISDNTLPNYLGDSALTNNRGLAAVGCIYNNVIDFNHESIDNLPKAVYNILHVGRLDKPYVEYTFDKIIKFSETIKDKINFIIIGSSADIAVEKKLRNKLSNCSNLNALFLGYLHPMPRSVFEIADVSIASAGCAWISFCQGVKTITIDSNDWEPLGILGYTTKNCLYRENEPIILLEKLLADILISRVHFTKDNSIGNHVSLKTVDYSCHLDIINKLRDIDGYCDINYKRSILEKIVYCVMTIGGFGFYKFMMGIRKTIKNIIYK